MLPDELDACHEEGAKCNGAAMVQGSVLERGEHREGGHEGPIAARPVEGADSTCASMRPSDTLCPLVLAAPGGADEGGASMCARAEACTDTSGELAKTMPPKQEEHMQGDATCAGAHTLTDPRPLFSSIQIIHLCSARACLNRECDRGRHKKDLPWIAHSAHSRTDMHTTRMHTRTHTHNAHA